MNRELADQNTFRVESSKRWASLLKSIFPKGVPTHCAWDKPEDIGNVLMQIAKVKSANHTMLPDMGGLDLDEVKWASEKPCLELQLGSSAHIVNPKLLEFEGFPDAPEWAYFRLVVGKLRPSGIADDEGGRREWLTYLGGSKYAAIGLYQDGNMGYDENGRERPLPRGTTRACRHFSGTFLVVAKISTYNADPSTYDGRHGQMTGPEFRAYMDRQFQHAS